MSPSPIHQNKIRKSALLKRLFALLAFATILGLISLALFLMQKKQLHAELTEAFHQSEISLIELSFENEFSVIRNDLFVIGDSSEVAAYMTQPNDPYLVAEMDRIFRNFQGKTDSYRTLTLYAADGGPVIQTKTTGPSLFFPSLEMQVYQDAEINASSQPSIRSLLNDSKQGLLFTLPVLDANDNVACYLQIDYNLTPLVLQIQSHQRNHPETFYGLFLDQESLYESSRTSWHLPAEKIQDHLNQNSTIQDTAYTIFIGYPIRGLIQSNDESLFASDLSLRLLIQTQPPSFLYAESPEVRSFLLLEGALFLAWILVAIYLAGILAQREHARNQQRLMSDVFQSLNESLVITDEQEKIIYSNPAFCMMMGYSQDELEGRNLNDFQSKTNSPAYMRNLLESLDENGLWEGKLWEKTRQGDEFLKWAKIQKIIHPDQTIRYYGVYNDIDASRDTRMQDYHSTYYDLLTDLPNESLLPKLLKEAMDPHNKAQQEMAVAVIQLQNVNDSLELDSQVLKLMARRLMKEVSQTRGILSRSGLMEFTLTFPMIQSEKDLFANLARTKKRLESPIQIDASTHRKIPFSIGLALYPVDGEEPVKLIEQARIQASQEKSKVFNDQRLSDAYRRYLSIDNALRGQIDGGQFEIKYQPQVDPDTARPVAMEALIRWIHPDLGEVSPAEFIPVAENNGMIVPLGEWIFKQACTFQQVMVDQGINTVPISVNISMLQLEDPKFIEWMYEFKEHCRLPKGLIEVEITESLLMQNVTLCKTRLKSLADFGFKLSIDDFGTGYSSLAYLKELTVDKIKIDRLFIKDYPAIDDGQVLRSISQMLHGLSYLIVIEGVETEAQRNYVQKLKIEFIQGNYYSAPLSAKDIKKYLERF